MADATTKKLLSLLDAGQATEVRAAAALILGEIGAKDGDVAEGVTAALDDPEAAVRLRAIVAVGKLRVEPALAKLLQRVQAGGEEAEQAAQAAAKLGAKGTRALQDLMEKTAPGLRRRIAGALATGGTASAETAAVDALLDKDPGVVEAAVRSLIAKVPNFTPGHRQGLANQLLELLKDKKHPLTAGSETALVRLLTALEDKRAENVLWDRVGGSHPPEMRAAALQALGRWVQTPGKEQVKKLLACAVDADFRVVAPALMILKKLPAGKQAPAEWLELLNAHDTAVRGFAVEKLAERDTPEVAAALLSQLDHPDQVLREKTLACLAGMKHGRQALGEALLEAKTPEHCWLLAKALGSQVKDFPAAWRQPLLPRAYKWLDEGDRRGDALLFVLREADAEDLAGRLEERALDLRKKKKYAEAVNYLRLLARDPACAPALRMELAAAGLKVSTRDLAAEARNADPALQQFAKLLHGYEAETLTFLKKTKWLEPEELFYLGFHFAEKDGPPRRFGGEVLKMLIQRSPRAKIAQDAKRKLRGAGLD